MTTNQSTNVISALKVVREELLSRIESAAHDMEDFFANTQNGLKLQSAIEGIQQISGTLDMVQLDGPHRLAASILAVAQDITPGSQSLPESTLQSLTTAFFLLPRYLEFLENTKTDHPELLLPLINELRKSVGRPALPDSYFFRVSQFPKTVEHLRLIQKSQITADERLLAAQRARHMYQIGLVALLQNKPVKPPLKIMSNALERLASIYLNAPAGVLFLSASLALQSLQVGRVELSAGRKQTLMQVEKFIRTLLKMNPTADKTDLPRALTKEFIYWCSISPINPTLELSQARLLEAFGVAKANYTEKQLQKEAEILSGPSLNTIQSVISVFEEEIEAAKRMLELAAQAQSTAEFDRLIELLKKLSEILSVIGLSKPSVQLKEQAKLVGEIQASGAAPSRDSLAGIADALLQIESTVVQFVRRDGYQSGDSEATPERVIADRQLAEAEIIVLQEAETGLTMIKRALSAFAESNYDSGHIRNVCKTLATIKGGMTLLHRKRCADLLELAERFIEEELMTEDHPSVLQQLLETFADCVISIEYYVSALQSDKNTDDSILQIAENSLNSLGLRLT